MILKKSKNFAEGKKKADRFSLSALKKILTPLTGFLTFAKTFGYLDYLADLHDRLLSRFMRWLFIII